ncbi:MAG: hypothetical protein HYV41_05465 [Candidatus Magasanikbacteria bacterium]|nr:hypothetical protein [Candidatus Magasanikbacteria bacterium]
MQSKILISILFLTTTLLTGCSSATNIKPKAILDSDKELAPAVLQEKKEQVQYFVNYTPKNLPQNISPDLSQSTYELNNMLFTFIFSTTTPTESTNAIYLSIDRGKSWKTFFDSSNFDYLKKDFRNPKIPIGLFTENGKLYVDATNNIPQDGDTLYRFSTEDVGQTWNVVGCFKFVAEKYFVDGMDTRKGVRPHEMSSLKKCN